MKNAKYLFKLFSVLCLFRQINASPNNSSYVKINNQQLNTLAKASNAKANISVESGKYFSVQNDISSNLLDRFPELTTIINKIVTNETKITSSSSSSNEDILNISRPEITERVAETSPKSDFSTDSLNLLTFSPNQNGDSKTYQTRTNQNRFGPSIVLGYKPITSFYHPRPVTLAQIIPQGTPWPDSKEGYKTTLRSKIQNKENVTQKIEEHTTFRVEIPQSTKAGETIRPDSTQGHQTSIGTKPKSTTASKTTLKEVESSTQHFIPPAIILDYKPITSFHHPHPVTLGQIIPTGTPWPDSIEGHPTSIGTKPKPTTVSKTTVKEVESSTQHVISPPVILEYQPITSFFHPNPVTPAQIIPSGTPWPDSIEGYETSIGTIPPASTNKIDELQTTTKKQQTTVTKTTVKEVESSTQNVIPPAIILEYQPITSFFHPNPVTPAQIIPSGTPWPDSIEGYQTPIGTKPSTLTNEVDEKQTTSRNKQTTVSKTTLQEVESSTSYIIPPVSVLGYKPITSFYHPHPITLAQIVPSGTPWPDSVKGYKTSIGTKAITSNQVNQITQEPNVSEVETNTNNLISAQTDLEYKPVTSFFHPKPVTVAQIISPGKPWPDSSEGYETTTLSNKDIKVQSTARINFIPSSTVMEHKNELAAVAKIISSGIDWPYPAGSNIANLEQTFLNLTEEISSNVENEAIDETKITTQKQFKTKPVSKIPSVIVSDLLLENTKADLLEPNALQIELGVTDSSNLTPIPFTSGTPKTTLSDIADILTDVYNITLVNSSSTAKPSELSSRNNTTKVDLNYHNVLIPQENRVDKNNIEFLVYDGVPKSEETVDEERIFHNPKVDEKTD